MSGNIVAEWLRSLGLLCYFDSFVDNGYDDLEVCKKISEPDLDAIGVREEVHREVVIAAVRKLKEQGGAPVYFTLENPGEAVAAPTLPRCEESDLASWNSSSTIGFSSRRDDDYGDYEVQEEGRSAGEGRSSALHMKVVLRDKLVHDGIRLNCTPYSKPVSLPFTSTLFTNTMRSLKLFTKTSGKKSNLQNKVYYPHVRFHVC